MFGVNALAHAQKLIDHGIPVIVCKPNLSWTPGDKSSDLRHPAGWAAVTAADCHLSDFREGLDALAMVCGHGIDVVDVDGKAGGQIENMPPFRHFGSCSTPSSTPAAPSTHLYVRSTGIAKISPLKSSAGHVGDYGGGAALGGGRMLAYLEGSSRLKYPGLTYTEIEPLDLDALFDSEPDDELIHTLLASGGSYGAGPGKARASRAEVKRFRAPRGPRADASSLTDIAGAGECKYGRTALHGMLSEPVAVGGRHGWTVATTIRVVELVNLGCATVADLDAVEARLDELKPEGGTDFGSVLSWAITNVGPGKGCNEHMKLKNESMSSTTDEPVEEPVIEEVVSLDLNDPSFWGAMPQLEAIHAAARAGGVAPWALFGAILTIIDATIPPWVVLPPVIGDQASLNIFGALIGPSGAGKGIAFKVARRCIDLPVPNVKPLGTGEGLVKLFVSKVQVPIGNDNSESPKGTKRLPATRLVQRQHAESALVFIPEVATLNAVGFNRPGATLLPMLTSGCSGEALGFSNSDPLRTLDLGEHLYRLAVLIGVQPTLAGALLEAGADGGLPQRHFFMPCTDENAPSIDDWPDTPARIRRPAALVDVTKTWPRRLVRNPELLGFTPLDHEDSAVAVERIELPICEAAVRDIRMAATSKLRGEACDLDGHALLMREKIAALMSVLFDLDGGVEEWIWELAGFVMTVSDHTRDGIMEILASQRVEHHRDRGIGMAQTSSAADAEGTAIKAVRNRLLVLLDTPRTHREVLQRFDGPTRARAAAVLNDMHADGSILCSGKHYHRAAAT